MPDDITVAGAIRGMAKEMRYRADELDRLADDIDRDGDLSRAGSALNIFAALTTNARLDLIATRLHREMERRQKGEVLTFTIPKA